MNIYFFAIIIVSVAILLGSMNLGLKKGFANRFDVLVSLVLSACIAGLLGNLWKNLRAESTSGGGLLAGIVMLLFTVTLYKLFHLVFSGLDLIARLPIIRRLDSALGLVLGLIEGFVILYLLEYLLRNYLLV